VASEADSLRLSPQHTTHLIIVAVAAALVSANFELCSIAIAHENDTERLPDCSAACNYYSALIESDANVVQSS
jgi:hypothetical protein